MCSSSFQSNVFHDGGYDYQFVDDIPTDEYYCLICQLVAREAQQASCCGKVFCKPCVEALKKSDTRCPNCREKLRYFPDKRAIRNILQLRVYCEREEEGCMWEGEVRDAETHLDSCPYRLVPCPNQCTKAVRSKNLLKHLKTQCPNREVRCSLCKQIGKHAYISTDHLEKCPDFEIDCPNNGCQEKPKRKNIEDHRQQCPKETISCEYAKIGCEHVCLREKMSRHNRTETQTHLQLAVQKLSIVCTLSESRAVTPQKHVFKMTDFSKLKENGNKSIAKGYNSKTIL